MSIKTYIVQHLINRGWKIQSVQQWRDKNYIINTDIVLRKGNAVKRMALWGRWIEEDFKEE